MFKRLAGIFGDSNERELQRLQPTVDRVNALESDFERLGDHELKDKAFEFKGRMEAGEKMDSLFPEAYTLAIEMCRLPEIPMH